jgi:kynurenine 3-monooxygenase
MSKKEKIIIVGAGLCGSLLALRMAQRGHQVVVYEKRGDMRLEEVDAGRSINLALSARGLMALDRVGLKKTIAQSCIPMNGRMIHPLNGDSFLSPYSGRSEDYINSVSRSDLNILLLNEADYNQDVTLCFDSPVKEVDLKNASVKFIDPKTKELKTDQGDIIIGTDGAGSVVRRSLMSRTTELLFNYEQNFLRHGYKELSILPKSDGGWRIEKNALHIWPRGHFMIIALPNLDGSFTVTMFHPYGSDIGFNALDSDEKVKNFFEKYFPTLIEYMPDYVNEYNQNPVGTLGTIKCYPWQAYGKTLIMGDASHAIVPFYGQGMNASFEDVRVFDDMMNLYGEDWPTIFEKFQDTRVNNANAIADLAIDNFYEMRDKVDDKNFKLKRQLEMQLEQQYPEYYSKYSLVTFKPDLGYHDAMVQGRNQDSMLLDICDRVDSVSDVNLSDVFNQLKNVNKL